MAGDVGFEPTPTESESIVLPITPIPNAWSVLLFHEDAAHAPKPLRNPPIG
jgi:hypothetical protein